MMKTLYMIAGEPSGDFIGQMVIQAIKKNSNNRYYYQGIGGKNMIDSGLTNKVCEMHELSIMGIDRVLLNALKMIRLINAAVDDIIKTNPEYLITIDSPGFCFRVVKKLKTRAPHIKCVHFVAPTVWAHKPNRSIFTDKNFLKLFVLFAFETKYFSNAVYVGSPAVLNSYTKVKNKKKKTIIILPGSREQEIKRLLKIFLTAASLIDGADLIVLANDDRAVAIIKNIIKTMDIKVHVTKNKALAFSAADVAVAKLGTNNLELAQNNIPFVACIKVGFLTNLYVSIFVKLKFYSMINILAGKQVVKELVGLRCNPNNIAQQLNLLLFDENHRQQVLQSYEQTLHATKLEKDWGSNICKELNI